MSSLNLISDAVTTQPPIMTVYGGGGLGKSTLASEFPAVVFIPVENPRVKTKAFPKPESLEQFYSYLKDLTESDHKFRTLVIDSLDALETLVARSVCASHEKTSLEDWGYGKGWAIALEEHKRIRSALESLRDQKGMTIVLIAHSQTKPYNDPLENAAYDRHSIKLNEKASALYVEFSDAVLFMSQKVHVVTENNKTKAYGQGERVLYTEARPSHLAKNRFGLPYEISVPQGKAYEKLWASISAGDGTKVTHILESISRMAGLLDPKKDERVKSNVEKAVKEAGQDLTKLLVIQDRLKNITSVGGLVS